MKRSLSILVVMMFAMAVGLSIAEAKDPYSGSAGKYELPQEWFEPLEIEAEQLFGVKLGQKVHIKAKENIGPKGEKKKTLMCEDGEAVMDVKAKHGQPIGKNKRILQVNFGCVTVKANGKGALPAKYTKAAGDDQVEDAETEWSNKNDPKLFVIGMDTHHENGIDGIVTDMTVYHEKIIIDEGVFLGGLMTKTFIGELVEYETADSDTTSKVRCGEGQVMVGANFDCDKSINRITGIYCKPVELF